MEEKTGGQLVVTIYCDQATDGSLSKTTTSVEDYLELSFQRYTIF